MGIRKNAKFLTATERENFVKACVLMKADIVNPAAAAANRYSRWDEAVAIHRMIQNANSPAHSGVNFGHGGTGAYSFFSWHRYFLYRFELQLQSYVPGVMLPYWDWSDPAPLMTDTFLGPNGATGTSIVGSGYFAPSAPGSGGNPTTLPSWWPSTLTGWNLHAGFGTLAGPLTRALSPTSGLPTVTDIRETLAKTGYSAFQSALEAGTGITSFNQMHNGIHGWVGGHMSSLTGSPFDPFFYLHHCNIDRLWAMWQMDGHMTEYPSAGANPEHGPTDIMYPWTGGATGYSSNYAFGPIVMPNFSALGAKHNVDTLDHRAFGYSYDTLAIVGVSLDRTGSMMQLTPDPMTTGAPDVTKWVAATRGVSAFLQDCEAAYLAGQAYVYTGIKTFRTLASNEFSPVFAGSPSGLVRPSSGYSRASFDSAISTVTPGGSTPLADALADTETTLVEAPFGGAPAGERRYLAMFTDGLLTAGSPMSSIAAGAYANTAVFAMGFGTAADVDYATIASIVSKGATLSTQQVFHGENAGTIDKFYTNALAAAIGFSPVVDPVIELFAGEYMHVEFYATSAEDSFFVSAQGMDFHDPNWTFQLMAPDGSMVYADGPHAPMTSPMTGARTPDVAVRRSTGRLSLFLQRNSADDAAWIGEWSLMVSYKARGFDRMVMTDLGELIVPVAAGPVRGPRYARLLSPPEKRVAARSVGLPMRHALDVRPSSTNSNGLDACSVLVNVFARTRLVAGLHGQLGKDLAVDLGVGALLGTVTDLGGISRMIAPRVDIASKVLDKGLSKAVARKAAFEGADGLKLDSAKVLARLEAKEPAIAAPRDEVLVVSREQPGSLGVRATRTTQPGVYHVGMYVEGVYHPDAQPKHPSMKMKGMPATQGTIAERFTRILSLSLERSANPVPVPPKAAPVPRTPAPVPRKPAPVPRKPAPVAAKPARARKGTKPR